jgi:hypothetical protein
VPLPANTHIIASTRDRVIFDLPLPTEPPQANRIAVLWDGDRDERILDVMTALHFRDLRVRAHVIALAERGGVVTVWVGSAHDVEKMRAIIQAAADAALRPRDRWTVAPLVVVETRNGVLDKKSLLLDERLASIPYNLGLVCA